MLSIHGRRVITQSCKCDEVFCFSVFSHLVRTRRERKKFESYLLNKKRKEDSGRGLGFADII